MPLLIAVLLGATAFHLHGARQDASRIMVERDSLVAFIEHQMQLPVTDPLGCEWSKPMPGRQGHVVYVVTCPDDERG